MTIVTQDKTVDTAQFDAFREQIQAVVDTAARLHACKAEGNYDEFHDACVAAGLTHDIGGVPASQFYWDRMDGHKSEKPLADVKNNTQLTATLGIQLNGKDTLRNRLLYDLFQTMVDRVFQADIIDGPHVGGSAARNVLGLRSVTMHDVRPGVGGAWNIPVYTLFQGKLPSDYVDRRIAAKAQPLVDALGPEMGMKLGSLLFHQQMILPDALTANLAAKVLRRGMDGHEIVLAGAFCPDYAYEKTDDPNLPYRYTFDGLGTGVGLVAQQFARVIPPLSKLLTQLGVKHRVVLGIGDFEADAESVLKRVGCDYDEFVRRCSESLRAFSELSHVAGIPLTLELCDADRNKGRLRPYAGEATQRMLRGDFGRMSEVFPNPEQVVQEIIRDNGTFYKRWYGPETTDEQIRRIVLTQGGEYAALSRIYAEDFGADNVIVISGDRPMMHAFDNVDVVLPTLCVKRAY